MCETFQPYIALALTMLAMTSGCWLISKACEDGFFCKKTGRFLGGLIIVVSLLSMISIVFHGMLACSKKAGKSCHKKETSMPYQMEGWTHPPIPETEPQK